VFARKSPGHLEELLDPTRLGRDPYQIYRTLRDEAPIYWSERHRAWLVTRHENVKWVLTTPELFSSAERVGAPPGVSTIDWQRHSNAFADFTGFFWSDPPSYTRHRKLWTSLFRPRLAVAESIVERVVGELLDGFSSSSEIDALHDFGLTLPATVILEFLGIPTGDRLFFREVAEAMITGGDTAREAMDDATVYLSTLFEARQTTPADDMISGLVRELGDISLLSAQELRREVVTIVHFLLAGHETTASSISNSVLLMLCDRRLLAQLQDNDQLIPAAVEEFMRFESPLQFLDRRLAASVEVEGQTLGAGETVMAFIGSANRDERMFQAPDQLIVDRHPNKHLAFGFNIHFCLGAALARLETVIALRRLVQRFPGLRLAENADPQWRDVMMFRMLEGLPVVLR